MRILSHLMNNCRESDRQIGRDVGISGNAVNSRIKKLEGAGTIRGYTIKIEPPILGYGLFYIVVSGGSVTGLIKQIKSVGEPFFIVPCVGGVTVCGIVTRDSIKNKIKLVKDVIKGARVLTAFEAGTDITRPNLTKTDLEIIDRLLTDPRRRIEDISRDAGLSAKTVARSLDKLYKNENVQFTAMYDPTKLGNHIPYAVLTWISGDMKKIKKEFDKKFEKMYMQVPFLTKDQVVLFMYGDNIFKLDQVTQKIRSIGGVQSTDIFIPKSIVYPDAWLRGAIRMAKRSPTLHLAYQTN